MRTLTIALATGLIALLLGGAIATGAAYMYAPSTENPTVQSGCVIRFDAKTASGNTRPRIHANDTHYCIGVTSVYADYPSGDLVIKQHAAAGPVVSIAVSEDETLAARGIHCGASGGMTTTLVRCYRNGSKVKAYSATMYGSTANLWIGWTSWAA